MFGVLENSRARRRILLTSVGATVAIFVEPSFVPKRLLAQLISYSSSLQRPQSID